MFAARPQRGELSEKINRRLIGAMKTAHAALGGGKDEGSALDLRLGEGKVLYQERVLVDVDPVPKLGGRGVECQQGVRGLPGVGGLSLQPEQLRAQPVAARHERVAKLLR